MKTLYDKFKSIFKKGEQVCIYGIDWDAYGYITNIEEDGVTLTKLNNIKGVKYGWNCFEVICHSGFKVYKSSETEVSNIFQFKISTHLPRVDELKSAPREVRSSKITNIQLVNTNEICFATDLLLRPEEIEKGFYIYEGEYKNVYGGIYLNFLINGYDIKTFWYDNFWKKIEVDGHFKTRIVPENSALIYPVLNDTVYIPIIGVYSTDPSDLYFKFSKSGFYDIPFTNDGIEDVRKNKWVKKGYTACGDPYIFEGAFLGNKIWSNNDGYLISNEHADIYI